MHRAAAALVAIVCWSGLAVQFSATYAGQHDLAATIWVLARYFTVLTNLALASAMTWVAVGGRPRALLLGGLTVAIVFVGIVYSLLLAHLHHFSGPARVADILLHKLSPLLMAAWWIVFSPRANLRPIAAFWWSLYPLAYFAYVLARGSVDGRYPYPFIDVAHVGWLQTALNAAGIAFAFLVLGLVLVGIDRWRPLGSRRSSR